MEGKDWVDFREVKAAVTMEMALEHYDINLRRTNKTYLRGNCPLPTHSKQATKNSFTVNREKNVWACQSASCVDGRDGRKGGNVLDFVSVMEGCSIRDAALRLQEWFNVQASNERPDGQKNRKSKPKPELVGEKTDEKESVKEGLESDGVNKPLKFTLKNVDSGHEYLTRRGIKEETAEHFGVGFFHGKGSMAGRIVIPIHNEERDLIAYAGRAIEEGIEPKYKLPTGFRKSLEIFNLHRTLGASDTSPVVVVEGYFDCMKVHQAGFQNVVALMGSALGDAQEALLIENFDRVLLMLDGDSGGRSATTEIVSQIMHRVFVRVVDVPEGKQPDQLSSEQIQAMLGFLRDQK